MKKDGYQLKKESKAFDNLINQFIKVALYCTFPPVILVITVTIALTFVNSRTTSNIYAIVLLQQSLPIILSYGLFPLVIYSKLEKQKPKSIGLKKNKHFLITILNIFAVIIFMSYLFYKGIHQKNVFVYVIHYFFVALVEEILVRGIIYFQLFKLTNKKWLSVLICAFIFALVFHSTDGIWINIIYRVPFSIITSLLYLKTESLMTSVNFHWMYNVILTIKYI